MGGSLVQHALSVQAGASLFGIASIQPFFVTALECYHKTLPEILATNANKGAS